MGFIDVSVVVFTALTVYLTIGALFSVACYEEAKEKGIDTGAWIIIGLLFNIFGLMAVCFAPPKPIESESSSMNNKCFIYRQAELHPPKNVWKMRVADFIVSYKNLLLPLIRILKIAFFPIYAVSYVLLLVTYPLQYAAFYAAGYIISNNGNRFMGDYSYKYYSKVCVEMTVPYWGYVYRFSYWDLFEIEKRPPREPEDLTPHMMD